VAAAAEQQSLVDTDSADSCPLHFLRDSKMVVVDKTVAVEVELEVERWNSGSMNGERSCMTDSVATYSADRVDVHYC